MAKRSSKVKKKPINCRHLAELGKSAVNINTAKAAGLYSEGRPEEIAGLLGRKGPAGDALVFPYRTLTGKAVDYCRLKPDEPRSEKIKYEAPGGKPVLPFFPPNVGEFAKNPKLPIILTEGEKKALAIYQAGYNAIGLAGVWAWTKKEDDSYPLLPELEKVAWKGRVVHVIFDSDVAGNKRSLKSESELKKALEQAGATVAIVRLKGGPKKKKQGIDDVLVAEKPGQRKRALENLTAERGTDSHDRPGNIVIHPPMPIRKCLAVFQKWLYLPSISAVELSLGVVATSHVPGDPAWLLLVDRSGTGKTEILRPFDEIEEVEFTGHITDHALISGWRTEDGTECSLLSTLHGMTLVIKDAAPMLSMSREACKTVLGQLRDAYDGVTASRHGCPSGEDNSTRKHFRCRFNLIMAATPAIEKYTASESLLGERFLRLSLPPVDEKKRVTQAMRNVQKEDVMRKELHAAVGGALAYASKTPPKVPAKLSKLIVSMARFLAAARCPVSHNRYTREIDVLPSPESGTRIVKELTRMGKGVGMLYRRKELTEHEMKLLGEVVWSSVPAKRQLILGLLMKLENQASQQFQDYYKLPSGTVHYLLDDLRSIRLIDRTKKKEGRATKHTYFLTPAVLEVLKPIRKYFPKAGSKITSII